MQIVGFPTVVNEKAARVVAAGVVVMAVATLITGWRWLPVVMAVGFGLRVLSGPRLSPLGRLAAQVISPRMGEPKLVPGAPKRFAQFVGLLFTGTAAVAWWAFDASSVGVVVIGALLIFAALEAALGFCAGCYVFGHLMRWGLVPQEICVECADISLRAVQRQ